jgi:hypothetical protein
VKYPESQANPCPREDELLDALGAGFIASAAVSLKLSRRLGLWEDSGAPPEAIDETGLVR